MYTYFTEYRIHESLNQVSTEYIVVVNKNGIDRCAFSLKDSPLNLHKQLEHLDDSLFSGWPIDQDVGACIATYSIITHPELFI